MNLSRIFNNFFFLVFLLFPVWVFRKKKLHIFVKQNAFVRFFYVRIAFALQTRLSKIYKQFNRFLGQAQIIEQLGTMGRKQFFDRLKLYNYIIDHQIHFVILFHFVAFVVTR